MPPAWATKLRRRQLWEQAGPPRLGGPTEGVVRLFSKKGRAAAGRSAEPRRTKRAARVGNATWLKATLGASWSASARRTYCKLDPSVLEEGLRSVR